MSKTDFTKTNPTFYKPFTDFTKTNPEFL